MTARAASEEALNARWLDRGVLPLFTPKPLEYYDLNSNDKVWVSSWLKTMPKLKQMLEHAKVTNNRELISMIQCFETIIAHFRFKADSAITLKAISSNVTGEIYDWYCQTFEELEMIRKSWLKACKAKAVDPAENREELYESYQLYFMRTMYIWLTLKRNQLPLDIECAVQESRLEDVKSLTNQAITLDEFHLQIVDLLPEPVAVTIRDEFSEKYFPNFKIFLSDAKELLRSQRINVDNYLAGFDDSQEARRIRRQYESDSAKQRISTKPGLDSNSLEADNIRKKYPSPQAIERLQARRDQISALPASWENRLNEVETSCEPNVRARVSTVYRVCAEIRDFCVDTILEAYAGRQEDSETSHAVRRASEDYLKCQFFTEHRPMLKYMRGATSFLPDARNKKTPLERLLQTVIDQVDAYTNKIPGEKPSRDEHIEQALTIKRKAQRFMERLSESTAELDADFREFYNELKFWYQTLEYESYSFRRGFGLLEFVFGPMRSFVLAKSLLNDVEMIAARDPALAAHIRYCNPPDEYPFTNLKSSPDFLDDGEILLPPGLTSPKIP